MTDIIKAEGFSTLKNIFIDSSCFTALNLLGDWAVESIVTYSNPFAGVSLSFAANGADLLGKVVSTRYRTGEDLLSTALRAFVLGTALIGSSLATPNLAGRVGMEISKEAMCRYTATAILILLLKNKVVPRVVNFFSSSTLFSASKVDYHNLTAEEVNDPQKYSDDQILQMDKYIKENRESVCTSGYKLEKAIEDRVIKIKDKPENLDYKAFTEHEVRGFSDAKILEIEAFLLSNTQFSNEKKLELKPGIADSIWHRAALLRAQEGQSSSKNIDYKNLTLDSISKMSDEQILEIDIFFISLSREQNEKLDEIPEDVRDEIYNRSMRIKAEKLDYKRLTLKDVSEMRDNEILSIEAFFLSKTSLSKEKLHETSEEVQKAISVRAKKIKNNQILQ